MTGAKASAGWVKETKKFRISAMFMLTSMLIALSALSYVPSPGQLRSQIFIVLYILFFAFAVSFNNWRVVSLKWLLLLFFSVLAVVVNLYISIVGEVDLDRWVRSFVPMFFFISIVAASFYVRLFGCERMLQLLLISCFFYCAFLLMLNFPGVLDFINVGGRLTFYVQEAVVPYPFLGVILSALLPRISIFTRIFLVFLFMMFVLAVGYKIQILFLLAFGIYCVFIASKGAQRLFYVCVFAFGLLLLFTFLGDYIIQRFSSIGGGGDEVRLLEVQYAWQVFKDNPMWGGGLGTEVPLSLTRPGYAEISELWESDTVSYIHNFPMYLLMVGGGVFFLIFFVLMKFAGILKVSNLWSRNECSKSAMWCSLALIIFFLTSAAFKQVQSVIMLSFFVAILSSSKNYSARA